MVTKYGKKFFSTAISRLENFDRKTFIKSTVSIFLIETLYCLICEYKNNNSFFGWKGILSKNFFRIFMQLFVLFVLTFG